MAQVANFVSKLTIFSNMRRLMSSRIFCPSNTLLVPETCPYSSKYLPKHVFFFNSPASKWGGGMSLLPHIEANIMWPLATPRTSPHPLAHGQCLFVYLR